MRAQEAARQLGRRAREVLKGSRWLLLRNAKNLKHSNRVKLKELLAANRRLATVYAL